MVRGLLLLVACGLLGCPAPTDPSIPVGAPAVDDDDVAAGDDDDSSAVLDDDDSGADDDDSAPDDDDSGSDDDDSGSDDDDSAADDDDSAIDDDDSATSDDDDSALPLDADGDGYSADDCDDSDPSVHPGADEVCLNGIDDDCDATTPDGFDADGDGFACYIDCDDSDPAVHPAAEEICGNGVEDDCDASTVDLWDYDFDGADCLTDCDDADAGVHPAAPEVGCNGVDDDCDAATSDVLDADGDGTTCASDCDDSDPAVHPGADEVCDFADTDCDGSQELGVPHGFPTLQDAFDASAADDLICVDAGVWVQTAYVPDHDLTVEGVGTATLEGPAGAEALRARLHNSTLTLRNLTLTSPAGVALELYGSSAPGDAVLYLEDVTLSGSDVGADVDAQLLEASGLVVEGNALGLLSQSDVNVISDSLFTLNTQRALVLEGQESSLEGCTFADNTSSWGGAALFAALDQLVVNDSQFDGNVSSSGGGAVELDAIGQATFNDCEFTANQGDDGGGIRADFVDAGLVLNGGAFVGNTAADDGGGVHVDSTGLIATGVFFDGNSAAQGGAVSLYYDPHQPPGHSLLDCTFVNNDADEGGALHVRSTGAELTGSTFEGNTAIDGGGAFLVSGLEPVFGGSFSNNTASNNGGGVLAHWDVVLSDMVFEGNVAANVGGGLHVDSGFDHSLSGLSFTGNSALNGAALYLGGGDTVLSDVHVLAQVDSQCAVHGYGASIDWVGGSIVGNSGAGLVIAGGGTVELSDVLIADNLPGPGIERGGTVDLSLEGVTISGHEAAGLDALGSNGALELSECVISENGGGVVLDGYVTVSDSTFEDNTLTGGLSTDATAVVSNSTFTNNTSTGHGGGLRVADGLTLTGSSFSNNEAGLYGGAVRAGWLVEPITDCLFDGNSAARGGAVDADWAAFERVLFRDNEASEIGGAVRVDRPGSLGPSRHVVFEGNHAGLGGGAFSIGDGFGSLPLVLGHVSFVDNTAGAGAAVLQSEANHDLLFTDSVVVRGPGADPLVSSAGGVITFEGTSFDAAGPASFSNVANPLGVDGNRAEAVPLEPPPGATGQLAATAPAIDAATGLDPDGSPADRGAFGGLDSDLWDADGDGAFAWRGPGPYDPVLDLAAGLDCDDGDPTVFPGTADPVDTLDQDCDGVP